MTQASHEIAKDGFVAGVGLPKPMQPAPRSPVWHTRLAPPPPPGEISAIEAFDEIQTRIIELRTERDASSSLNASVPEGSSSESTGI